MADFETGRDIELISRAGIVLRALSPPKVATLLFVKDGIRTQREMAERLDRTPPAISNYIEELEELPVSLVRKEGSERWITSEGEEVLGFVTRLTNNLGRLNLRRVEWDQTSVPELLDDLDSYLDPLHTFRDVVAYHVLYAIGVQSSGWLLDDPGTVLISDVMSAVKRWDDSATKKQIHPRLNKFSDANAIEADGQRVQLTEKGLEQCRLLDHVMQMLDTTDSETHVDAVSMMARPDHSLDLSDVDGESDRTAVEFDKSLTAAYCTDTPVLSLPSTLTVGELIDTATDVGRNLDEDVELELKWMVKTED